MDKIMEFTEQQYQLEQDLINPPDDLIKNVRKRIAECELASIKSPTKSKKAAAVFGILIAASFAAILVVAAFYIFDLNNTPEQTIPVNDYLTEPPVEPNIKPPPVEEEIDTNEENETEEVETETEENQTTIENEPPSLEPPEEELDERIIIRIRPPE